MGHQVIPITQDQLYEPLKLKQIFEKEKPDYIFHLAAYGNMSNQTDVPMTVFANIIGTFNMLSASSLLNYKKFINFSTSSVLIPKVTYYSASKKSAEELCKAFVSQANKPILTVRPFSIYGEGEADFRFIPTVCRSLILDETLKLDPKPTHDWVYVEDFVKYLIKNLDTDKEELNIGTGIATSNEDIVRKLAIISGRSCHIDVVSNLRNYDSTYWVNSEKLKLDHSLDTGLLNTYKYYEKKYKSS